MKIHFYSLKKLFKKLEIKKNCLKLCSFFSSKFCVPFFKIKKNNKKLRDLELRWAFSLWFSLILVVVIKKKKAEEVEEWRDGESKNGWGMEEPSSVKRDIWMAEQTFIE